MLVILAVALTFCSCSYKIIRTGYKTSAATDNYNCAPEVFTHLTSKDSLYLVGEIELKDRGFTSKCGEYDAYHVLKNEARSLAADVILITQVIPPDMKSTCYRYKAEMYRNLRTSRVKTQAIGQVAQPEMANKTEQKNKVFASTLGAALGFAIGYLLVTLIIN